MYLPLCLQSVLTTTVVNFFISYNPYIFNHKYMNDTNSCMFDIQSIFFVYIETVPLILNCFQHLKNERYFFCNEWYLFFYCNTYTKLSIICAKIIISFTQPDFIYYITYPYPCDNLSSFDVYLPNLDISTSHSIGFSIIMTT